MTVLSEPAHYIIDCFVISVKIVENARRIYVEYMSVSFFILYCLKY